MPKSERQRSAHPEERSVIQQRPLWPEQEHNELLRPILLSGDTSSERAEQTSTAERTLHRELDRFEREGSGAIR